MPCQAIKKALILWPCAGMAWQFCMKSSFKRSLFECGAVSIQISLDWLTWAILWISLFMSILLLPFLPCLVCVHIELCLLSCWEREVTSVAWVACRQIGCLASYFVVAIRRAWPESSICLSLRSLDIPRLLVSFCFLAWRPRSARRMESWHVHTAYAFGSGVSLESFSVEDRGTKGMAARPQGRKGLHLRPSPGISS